MKPLDKIAKEGKLSLGLVFPIESYQGSVPQMKDQEELAQLAEASGFKSLWFRDVPFHDPSFGDSGQMFDPFVYMAHIMNQTKSIALATGSIILPLRHPVHTLKSINSLQVLSKGRIIVGVASGDRPIEFPAFNKSLEQKNALFRDSFNYMKGLDQNFPTYQSEDLGVVNGNIDILPKSAFETSYLVTGHSGQALDWIATHADGWLYYPRNRSFLLHTMSDWKASLEKAGQSWKPYMQSLYIDLVDDDDTAITGIHLGFRSGPAHLINYLKEIQAIGVNHVILNLKFSQLPIRKTIEILGNKILPEFN